MSLEKIEEEWIKEKKDKNAIVTLWDSMAPQYKGSEIPDEEDIFVKMLIDGGMLQRDFRVLDIGCGTGKYSMAIASRVNEVVGIDISPKMIEYGKELLEEKSIKNVHLYNMEWSEMDLKNEGFFESFDLVFAHNTPAVADAITFKKLMDASKNYCALCKPTRRTDSITDKVREIAGLSNDNIDIDISYLFAYIWQSGYLPEIKYEKKLWTVDRTLNEAIEVYTNKVKTSKVLTTDESKAIAEYLKGLENNGMVHEDINTTLINLYWKKCKNL